MKTKDEFVKSYEKFLKYGFYKISLFVVVFWGIGTYALYRLLIYFTEGVNTFTSEETLIQIAIWIFMGIVFVGPFFWFLMQRNYKKGLKKYE